MQALKEAQFKIQIRAGRHTSLNGGARIVAKVELRKTWIFGFYSELGFRFSRKPNLKFGNNLLFYGESIGTLVSLDSDA